MFGNGRSFSQCSSFLSGGGPPQPSGACGVMYLEQGLPQAIWVGSVILVALRVRVCKDVWC
jgi:hypothetical protein